MCSYFSLTLVVLVCVCVSVCRVAEYSCDPASQTTRGHNGQLCLPRLTLYLLFWVFFLSLTFLLTSNQMKSDGCQKETIRFAFTFYRCQFHPFGRSLIFWPSSPLPVSYFPNSLFPFISFPHFFSLVYVHVCVCLHVCLCVFVSVCVCVCCGLWSVSAGHQSVCAEWAGGVGVGAEARRQQGRCGGETTAKPHGNRWVSHTRGTYTGYNQ